MTGIYGSSSNYMTKMARKGEFVDQIFLTMLGKKLSLLGCCFVNVTFYILQVIVILLQTANLVILISLLERNGPSQSLSRIFSCQQGRD